MKFALCDLLKDHTLNTLNYYTLMLLCLGMKMYNRHARCYSIVLSFRVQILANMNRIEMADNSSSCG